MPAMYNFNLLIVLLFSAAAPHSPREAPEAPPAGHGADHDLRSAGDGGRLHAATPGTAYTRIDLTISFFKKKFEENVIFLG